MTCCIFKNKTKEMTNNNNFIHFTQHRAPVDSTGSVERQQELSKVWNTVSRCFLIWYYYARSCGER